MLSLKWHKCFCTCNQVDKGKLNKKKYINIIVIKIVGPMAV